MPFFQSKRKKKSISERKIPKLQKINDDPTTHPEAESTNQGDNLTDDTDGNVIEEDHIPENCPEKLPNFAYGCHSRPVAIFSKAGPFVFSSMVSWPIFWLWRGLDWRNKQPTDVLPFYIRNTYIQAKIIQIGLIALGIAASLDLTHFKRKSKITKNDETGDSLPVEIKLKQYS